MSKVELQSIARRKFYIKRRNIVRRFFLTLFVVFFLIFFYKHFFVLLDNPFKINIFNNKLLNINSIYDSVFNLSHGKNLFSISPRELSKKIIQSNQLLEGLVIRKYLYPQPAIVVFVKEKDIWAVVNYETSNMNEKYVTSDGDLISFKNLQLNFDNDLLKNQLVSILCNGQLQLSKENLLLLKNIFHVMQNRFNCKINKFYISNNKKIEIFTSSNLRIKLGLLSPNLIGSLSKLNEIFNLVKKNSYIIHYIDISLENGALVKQIKQVKNSK